MEIIIANAAKRDLRPDISRIFVEGFYDWLKFFSKDKTKLARTFAHIFNPDVFYVAIENDTALGFAACTNGRVPSIQLKQREFRRHLGFIMGTIAYYVLKREFEDKPYPFEIQPTMGTIEFVATDRHSRGRGVATQIIQHIHEHTPYHSYALEVADTNTKAVHLYEKLGYQTFKKVPEKHAKRSGFDFYLYMKYTKPR
ncbi:GNAT family N-acetyltransferase [Lapidilactobacillus mulanensis]|uniref:GNAT family N-acetyltransferase n=1 Tax=Lapidilactobacillus mulanensis TaxID=2485999 RepID=A0ABW4DQP6_9LACO|nr:GNAT family N-acetyltransferase [Lapidilactobacillus mulanensis]